MEVMNQIGLPTAEESGEGLVYEIQERVSKHFKVQRYMDKEQLKQ